MSPARPEGLDADLTGPVGPLPPPRRRRVTGVLAGLALGVVGLVAVVGLVLAVGVVVPGLGGLSDAGTIAIPAAGPTLVLVGVVVTGLAVWLGRRFRRAARAVALLGAAATVVFVVAVTATVVTTTRAGGSIDLAEAVTGTTVPGGPDDVVPYAVGPDGAALRLVIYKPPPSRVPAPVMVYVHGGGWVGGDALGAQADMRRFADQGRLVVSVGYTLATATRPTWNVAGPEVGCALATVAARAGEVGGDPTRIVLAGDSAGGQLAVSVGYAAAAGRAASSCGGTVPRPTAVVVQYPAVDILDAYANGRNVLVGGDARGLGEYYTGGTPAQVPDRYRALLGTTVLTPAAPPTLVIGPTRDVLVPPAGVDAFVRDAQAEGVDAQLVAMPFANHAYDTLGTGTLGDQAKMGVIGAWLAKRGL